MLGVNGISMLGIRSETFVLSNANMPAGVYVNIDSSSKPIDEIGGFLLHIRSNEASYFRCVYYFEGSASDNRRSFINI